jgi:hypothetical protein
MIASIGAFCVALVLCAAAVVTIASLWVWIALKDRNGLGYAMAGSVVFGVALAILQNSIAITIAIK